MSATVFSGWKVAALREEKLKIRVRSLGGVKIVVSAIVFHEDQGSLLYTRLKREAAERVGIEYRVTMVSLRDQVEEVAQKIRVQVQDPEVTGVIIQKPWRQMWQEITSGNKEEFAVWWSWLTREIPVEKDVDGLSAKTHKRLEEGGLQSGVTLPATCKAVLQCLSWAKVGADFEKPWPLRVGEKYVILGKSDLLGKPLYEVLKHWGHEVDLLGSKAVAQLADSGEYLRGYDVVVAATGVQLLVKAEWLKPGAIVVDVGEPKPDVDHEGIEQVASFVTPVPGGVGPLTVVSLLENAVDLINHTNNQV
jgi:methylenetetrahydrofolate dehydrogenase (NADP+) / methenyltetrahydrofolate cyclohydrolase